MAATYEPIATQTLGSAATTVTFSSIPGTYTDLRIVAVSQSSTSNGARIKFNSDSGTNYSYTYLRGDGTNATSSNSSNDSNPYFWIPLEGSSRYSFNTIDIFSYAGSTYKTSLVSDNGDNNGAGSVWRMVSLWRNTSAITSIDLSTVSSSDFLTGSTFTLYGVKSA